MNSFIYGHWRGRPAREEVGTGIRYAYMTDDRHENGYWQALGSGYCTEFKPWPEELARAHGGDNLAALHRV